MAAKEVKPVEPDSTEEQALSSQEGSAAPPPLKGKARRAKKAEPVKPLEEPKEIVQAPPQRPWELVSDGTSVIEVKIISDGDQGKLLGDPELLKKIDEFIKGGKS
jgi:hypothetical protein